MPKVLYVCHNHPAIRAGGAEIYAYELFRAVRDAGEFEAVFMAKAGPPFTDHSPDRESRFGLFDEDPREYYFATRAGEFAGVPAIARRKTMYVDEWRRFLELEQPDIVHFQHTLFLGYDMLRATRRILPDVPILYTLHEYMPICHRNGKMVRTERVATGTAALCDHASPRRCHECFPGTPAETFLLRERFIKAALEHVDLFIAPSDHLRQTFIRWGLPPDKLLHEQYGRFPMSGPKDPPDAGRRRRLGYFGQLTPFKGVELLLEALRLLERDQVEVELLLWGGNLEFAAKGFREKLTALIEDHPGSIRFNGAYAHASFPELVASVDWVIVPSTWWENSPLVIQEAMMCRRPVITSNIGGMAEHVRDGVDGLHFRAGDPDSLAATIRRAVSNPGLWDDLRANVADPHPMERHLETIHGIYRDLLGEPATDEVEAA
jgi:glycosyltransferase involved in cell wall biosynthesis